MPGGGYLVEHGRFFFVEIRFPGPVLRVFQLIQYLPFLASLDKVVLFFFYQCGFFREIFFDRSYVTFPGGNSFFEPHQFRYANAFGLQFFNFIDEQGEGMYLFI
jgi:hypothetical protein